MRCRRGQQRGWVPTSKSTFYCNSQAWGIVLQYHQRWHMPVTMPWSHPSILTLSNNDTFLVLRAIYSNTKVPLLALSHHGVFLQTVHSLVLIPSALSSPAYKLQHFNYHRVTRSSLLIASFKITILTVLWSPILFQTYRFQSCRFMLR